MSYDDYWHGSPELFWAYRVAYFNELEYKRDYDNYRAWLNGLYNFAAFSTVEYNVNRKETMQPENYLPKPFDFKEMARRDIIEERRKQEELKVKTMLSNSMLILSKRKNKNKERESE
jgi:hypothetical protein